MTPEQIRELLSTPIEDPIIDTTSAARNGFGITIPASFLQAQFPNSSSSSKSARVYSRPPDERIANDVIALKSTTTPGEDYTVEDDIRLIRLKEIDGKSWSQIAAFFPGRKWGTLQARYTRKLKNPSARKSPAASELVDQSAEIEPAAVDSNPDTMMLDVAFDRTEASNSKLGLSSNDERISPNTPSDEADDFDDFCSIDSLLQREYDWFEQNGYAILDGKFINVRGAFDD